MGTVTNKHDLPEALVRAVQNDPYKGGGDISATKLIDQFQNGVTALNEAIAELHSAFPEGDHRLFNRQGAMFDRGETFSGVDYETGLGAVERLRPLVPDGATLTQFALQWILSFDAVTTVIPGGRSPEQVQANAAAADLPPLDARTMAAVQAIYDDAIRPLVHHRW